MRLNFLHPMMALLWIVGSCADDGPADNTLPDGGVDTDGAECAEGELTYVEDVSQCVPAATDYKPRENGSLNDTWEACISDDGLYHQIEPSVSSISRVEAYETISGMLWENDTITAQQFIDARILFEEEQGLGSRVARRYDVHYASPPNGSCEDEGIPAAFPDYCVGPAVLQPIVVDAFAQGALGNEPIVNAAKIAAALQWFLYVSSIKEATTCAAKAKDCDSSWAYYTGGTPRDTPIGLAADIDFWAPETHDRGYDGVLAVRCWRDLDSSEQAQNQTLQALAIDQLDRALLRGMAILIRQRFEMLSCSTGAHQRATLEWLRIVVPLFDRETRERDPAVANMLQAAIANPADQIDVDTIVAKIDLTYPCP